MENMNNKNNEQRASMSDFIVESENGTYIDPNRIVAFKNAPVAQKTIHLQKHFENQVEITDPCYPNEGEYLQHRLSLPIKTGTYDCITWKHVEPGDINNDRTMIIGIYLYGIEPNLENAEIVGSICVDTGSAGFFMNKPNYTVEEWDRHIRQEFESIPNCYDLPWPEFRRQVRQAGLKFSEVRVIDEGFYSSIGWGDGEYNVIGYRENGEYIAFEILGA